MCSGDGNGASCAYICFGPSEGALGKAFDLSRYTPEYVGKLYGAVSRAVDAKAFPAHQGSSCRMCDVQDACYTNGGSQSHLYDSDDPDFPPY